MRNQFIIRLDNNEESPVHWVRIHAEGLTPSLSHGSLADAANQCVGSQVIVLVPGSDVTLGNVSLPTQNRQRLLKAVPYALEEQIAEDVEDMHFALGARNEDGSYSVAMVERQCMDRWQERLREAGLNAEALIPETLALPIIDESTWSVLREPELTLVRQNRQRAIAVDTENAEMLLNLALHEAGEDKPEKVTIWNDDEQGEHTYFSLDDVEMDWQKTENGMLGLIAGHGGLTVSSSINLLQGDYSRREQLGKLWRPWRLAASLAAIWCAVQITSVISTSISLEKQSLALKQQAENIYRQAFPEAKKIPNPRVQMEQKLAELRGEGGNLHDDGFLQLLQSSGKALTSTNGLVLRSIRFKKGQLDVELEVPNLQVLDQLKQQLSSSEKMSVDIQSAAAKDNKVQGRLQIRRAG